MASSSVVKTLVYYIGALLFVLLSAFFIFYTVRLLYVTRGLTSIRVGGKGAYVGALVFPLSALLFAWATCRCIKAARRA